MPDGFKSLADIFNKDPEFSGIRKIINESDVVADFYKIFPDLEKVAKPVKVEKQTIFLRVENSAWRSELKFMEKNIIDKINQFYKDIRIIKVRFIS